MNINKTQKKVHILLIFLCICTPIGILLPMFFDAGDAWGEWSAHTVKDMIGYIPSGLAKYSHTWNAPLADYTLNSADKSVVHQSGYYMVSGVTGALVCYLDMWLISKAISRNEK